MINGNADAKFAIDRAAKQALKDFGGYILGMCALALAAAIGNIALGIAMSAVVSSFVAAVIVVRAVRSGYGVVYE